jgi:dihydrofolate synthase/folylpolyglutamate synthase
MIASILKEAGYKVGLYTSPHLLSFTERIRVNGLPISEDDWARLTDKIQPEIEAVNKIGEFGELTTFEILTAMAFTHFRDVKADWQVMEVGLGGRLDATNVVKPQVCVITSVSFDHMDVLGDTLDKIAGEKAGIIKPGVPVVSAPQFPEAMEVIEKVCRERGAKLIKAGKDFTWEAGNFDQGGQHFHLNGIFREYDLWIPLIGEHQMENAANAVFAAEVLSEKDEKITIKAIVNGLRKVDWPGRLQVLRKKPWVVIDGAHNVYSIKKLGEALNKHFKYDKLTLILGFSSDKDIPGMAAEAGKITPDIIVTGARNPRSVKPVYLVDIFQKQGIKPRTAESVAEAVRTALATAGPNDLICAAGSIFVISEVLAMKL